MTIFQSTVYRVSGTLPANLALLFPRLSRLDVSNNTLTGELVASNHCVCLLGLYAYLSLHPVFVRLLRFYKCPRTAKQALFNLPCSCRHSPSTEFHQPQEGPARQQQLPWYFGRAMLPVLAACMHGMARGSS